MARKISRRWANSIADGTNELYTDPEFQPPMDLNVKRYERLSDLFREGQALVEVCVKLKVTRAEFFDACAMSAKFKAEYSKGLENAEAWWNTLGRAGATGKKKIQPATYIFTMKHRFKWSDQTAAASKGSDADEMAKNTITPEMTPIDAAKIYNDEILNKK